jgi:hypothetical protein
MTTKNTPKNAKKFYCENCDFGCNKQSDWNRHIITRKHKNTTNTTNFTQKNAEFNCECGKSYKCRSALWRHKKTCIFETKNIVKEEINLEKIDENDLTYKKMFVEMMNENKEMRKTIQDIIPKIGGDINSHNTNNFNINVFLNEECKDALNIMDFVNSLQLQLKDLENTGKLGFVEGTSKIFINGLKELELHKRPIHCSDIKQETLYIKDNDTWEKENDNKDKMKKAIDEVTKANMKQLPKWVTQNQTFLDDDEYMKVISNIMTKMDAEEDKEKIINNIAKETIIENN